MISNVIILILLLLARIQRRPAFVIHSVNSFPKSSKPVVVFGKQKKEVPMEKTAITLIGSGTWGTALAQVLADNGHEVCLVSRSPFQMEDINVRHQNSRYFGDTPLNPSIRSVSQLSRAPFGKYVVLCVPAKSLKEVCRSLDPLLQNETVIINTAKGLDPETGSRLSSLIRRELSEEKLGALVTLAGPSHAEEVILRIMTCLCAVSTDAGAAESVQQLFSGSYFRVYTGKDEIGTEYGAAMKNVIALASGMIAGMGMGDNTMAALITRSLNELKALLCYHGGHEKTCYGLTGLGDLIVTCMSHHSRNYQAGYAIGKQDSACLFWKTNTATVEGVNSARIIHRLARAAHLNLPICEAVYSVLYENASPHHLAGQLMMRHLKAE